MISRISGLVAGIRENVLIVEINDIGYEVVVPMSVAANLAQQHNQRVTLHTIQQFEGNLAMGHMIPRLYGFQSAAERDFAQLLTRVKGISLRKALRIMSLPLAELAGAIHRGELSLLTKLPEVGKKTAAELVSELRDLMPAFVTAGPGLQTQATSLLSTAQRTALQILTTWGERPSDAQRWITEAVEKEPELTKPDEIVGAAYRVKTGARNPTRGQLP